MTTGEILYTVVIYFHNVRGFLSCYIVHWAFNVYRFNHLNASFGEFYVDMSLECGKCVHTFKKFYYALM